MIGALRLLVAATALGVAFAPAQAEVRWAVYYADKEPVKAFEPFRLLILDSAYHPPLKRLRERGKTLVGYLSVGEVEEHRPWYDKVRTWGILGDENPNWKGSHFVDLRDPRWTALVVEDLIPALLHKGFDGVFLDTLDNAADLENADPKRWAGMIDAGARLVASIHRHWPEIAIVQNRGYDILPKSARHITHALGESVITAWDFEKKTASIRSAEDQSYQINALKAAKTANPKLEILSLDYWDPADSDGIKRIYAAERAAGLSPYVATISLDRIVPEPRN